MNATPLHVAKPHTQRLRISLAASGVARSLVLAGHLLYASPLASRPRALRARLLDMSGTNTVLWAGTCPASSALRHAN